MNTKHLCILCGIQFPQGTNTRRKYCGVKRKSGCSLLRFKEQSKLYESTKKYKLHKSLYRLSQKKDPVALYGKYRRNALCRGYEFSIPYDDFLSFFGKPCTYCGENIETIGIDRIDNKKGYIPGNVTSCCSFCNIAKRDNLLEVFIRKCNMVATHYSLK